jgi:hypothetical protein
LLHRRQGCRADPGCESDLMRLDDRGSLVTISLEGQTVNVPAGAAPIAIELVQNSTPVFEQACCRTRDSGRENLKAITRPRRANPALPGNTARSQWPAETDACFS